MDPRIHRRLESEKGPGDLVSNITSHFNSALNTYTHVDNCIHYYTCIQCYVDIY